MSGYKLTMEKYFPGIHFGFQAYYGHGGENVGLLDHPATITYSLIPNLF